MSNALYNYERHLKSLARNLTPHEYYMILPALGISAASVTTISILVRGYTLAAQSGRNSVS